MELTFRYLASMAATFVSGNIFVSTILNLHQQLIDQSITDPLSGVYNLRKIDQLLNTHIENYRSTPQNTAILMIDTDCF